MPEPTKPSNTTESVGTDEEPPSSGCEFEIELIVDENTSLSLATTTIESAVQHAAASQGFARGTIGIRVTDDPSIRILNARHLGHDYATDVISFGYVASPPDLEGELVVSVNTAAREAEAAGWSTENELLLYIVHGVLHIAGMDDHEPEDRAAMREAEQSVFLELGIDQIVRCGADQDDIDNISEKDA